MVIWILGAIVSTAPQPVDAQRQSFDQEYVAYAKLLRSHIAGNRVNYTSLTRGRGTLDAIVAEMGLVSEDEFKVWTRADQIAYWINAYNVFTLQAIVDHYPIQRRWFSWLSFSPHNSIKKIPGVWTRLRWRAAGHDLTLDEIEHEMLRARYKEPRIHFAVNCAAVSCPPLRLEPYVGTRLDVQLARAARDFLDSKLGLQINNSKLLVSRIFHWYGEDFVPSYAKLVDTNHSESERAILGVVVTYGPLEAVRLAQNEMAQIRFLRYDWALNDNVPN